MLLVVVLVVLLGAPEGRGRSDDLGTEVTTIEGVFFLHPLYLLLDLFDLVCIVAEDHRSILAADIGPLLIGRGGIVEGKEELDQFTEGNLPRIVEQFHRLGVSGLSGADLFVGGVVLVPSHVAGYGIDDAAEGRAAVLPSPESAATEPGAHQSGITSGDLSIGLGNLPGDRFPLAIEV